MSNHVHIHRRWLVAITAAVAVVAAGCTSGAQTTGSSSSDTVIRPGPVNVSGETRQPEPGGTLEVSLFTFPRTLDPVRAHASAVTAGIPLAAIYGVLVRYNPRTGEFEPKMAKSLAHNDAFTTWTLTLRPDVTFTDGTPLNAQAVVDQFQRIVRQGRITAASIIEKFVAGYATPDPNTVVFHLTKGWSRFPSLLAGNAGMIASPTAVQERGDSFGRKPVGAGPFTLKSFVPGEEIVLVRNPDYWGDPAHLDTVRFTHIAGSSATVDRFRTGGIDLGTITNSNLIQSMIRDGVPGYVATRHGGGWMPNMAEGHPTADPRVRRAIAYAVDIQQLNQRAAGGTGLYHRTLFPETSRWDPGAAGVNVNRDKAKRLVAEVKRTTDWDGSLHIVAVQRQQWQWQAALTLQAQLNAVGFDATVEGLRNNNELIRTVFVKKDYDLASWVLTIGNAAPWVSLYSNLHSRSDRNISGYSNATMDDLLAKLRTAADARTARKTIADIQTLWADEQPFILVRSSLNYTFWGKQVHGIVPTSAGNVLLDDAFIRRT